MRGYRRKRVLQPVLSEWRRYLLRVTMARIRLLRRNEKSPRTFLRGGFEFCRLTLRKQGLNRLLTSEQ